MTLTNQREAEIKIRYDGDAFLGKRMDAKQFSSSIRSFINLLEKSNKLLNGSESKLKIDVTADIEQNCVELGFLISVIHSSLTSESVTSAKQLLEYLGIRLISPTINGLLGLLKILQERPNLKVEINGDGNTVNFVQGDNGTVITQAPRSTYLLIKDEPVKKEVLGTLSPLRKECENISFYEKEIGRQYEETERFGKEDIPNKKEGFPEIGLIKDIAEEVEITVRIVKAWYEGMNKWKFYSQKKGTIDASMDDFRWLRKFQNNRQLAPPGSLLKIKLQELYDIDIETNEIVGSKTYRVIEVVETFPPKRKMGDHEQLSF